eukprot:CAMPEP_0197074852 /NCGR_PEP_ID=MMETSP1384-20130603/211316_1 /TAXON_ID=29189 /ORGANISM="Ammonia sp." /LENGTH=394 /DNA_ID=CAMNT_0042513693 /DNA_START=1 /DNA_END=1181 /DNA_ORIENTATION=+
MQIRYELPRILKREEAELVQLRKYEKTLNQKKQEFEEKGMEFSIKRAFRTETEREKYRRLDQRIQSATKRIQLLKLDVVQYQKEYEMLQHEQISHDIEKYETEFEKKTDGEFLLHVVQKYGAKQADIVEYVKSLYQEKSHRIIIFSLFGATLNTLKSRLGRVGVTGAKQADIVEYVKSLYQEKSHRIIIFSLFGATLNTLKSRLGRVGVTALICQGNVHLRKRAMQSFQDTENNDSCPRVILLSVQHAASGADLNQATHVILVDPVPGSCSESFAAERQAVGRAVRQGMSESLHCTTNVIRFVVKDSIEHETHKRNEHLRHKLHSNILENEAMQYLRMTREQHEIDFYMNIKKKVEAEEQKEEEDGVGEENVSQRTKESGRKRNKWEEDSDGDG